MSTPEIKRLQLKAAASASATRTYGCHLVSGSNEPFHYSILAQSCHELGDPENAPSMSMWPYLLRSAQTQLLNQISIYSEHGVTPGQVHFLYMNACALTVWGEMRKRVKVLGQLHRPPRGAVLSFGMPFSTELAQRTNSKERTGGTHELGRSQG